MAEDISQVLGRIEGKLDQVIASAVEHRADDTRRFSDVFKRLDGHDAEINQAKGAKAAIITIASLAAGLVATGISYLAKAFGGH